MSSPAATGTMLALVKRRYALSISDGKGSSTQSMSNSLTASRNLAASLKFFHRQSASSAIRVPLDCLRNRPNNSTSFAGIAVASNFYF